MSLPCYCTLPRNEILNFLSLFYLFSLISATCANINVVAVKKKPLTRAMLIAVGIPIIFIPGLMLASLLGWDHEQGLAMIRATGYKQSPVIFPEKATVVDIRDGDTIEIDNGQVVRLLGINALDRGEERFEEARDYLKDLIEGEEVKLEYDTYQEDKFGRILAYVWEKCKTSIGCADGERLINFVMVKKGFAEVALYADRRKLKYQDLILSAQNQ